MRSLLNAHNVRRAMHAAADLMLNEELCAAAQRWADTLVSRDSFEHSLQRYNSSLVGLRPFAFLLSLHPSSRTLSHTLSLSLASPEVISDGPLVT